jgi:putative membrane protein
MSIHALLSFGRVYATRLVLTTYLFAFLIETLGIHTGWPFGVYSYDASLGVALLGVPLVVPCAWISMSHVAIIVARRMSTHWVFLYGGALLAVWDYFLDPQMVSAGRWHWKEITSHLPGTPDIPLSNFFGWLLAGSALIALLNKILPRERRKESANNTAMNIYLFWVFFSAVVGNLFFFDRPLVALVSFLSFGALIAPFFYKSTLGDSLA